MHLPVAEGEKVEGADSGPVPTHMCRPDDYTIFTELSRPMPDYALEHVFAQHGPVEWVRLAWHRDPAYLPASDPLASWTAQSLLLALADVCNKSISRCASSRQTDSKQVRMAFGRPPAVCTMQRLKLLSEPHCNVALLLTGEAEA